MQVLEKYRRCRTVCKITILVHWHLFLTQLCKFWLSVADFYSSYVESGFYKKFLESGTIERVSIFSFIFFLCAPNSVWCLGINKFKISFKRVSDASINWLLLFESMGSVLIENIFFFFNYSVLCFFFSADFHDQDKC